VRRLGKHKFSVYIRPLERITDRATNALCFLTAESDVAHIVTGPSEDLGLDPQQTGQINFTFRADAVLTEAFKRYFDWLWANSREITANNVALIPDLVLPEGTEEGARRWQAYIDNCINPVLPDDGREVVAEVDPVTGEIKICSEDGQAVAPPTEELGLPKLDQLAEQMARLYEKGALVSIDKLGRIPPLDAPLNPSLFGDTSELHKGNITRKVSMRVSIIDEKTLKEVDRRRRGLPTLLTKLSFGLADNIRWMPITACKLFESEVNRVNKEGHKLISDLLGGDIDAFIDAKRAALVADINGMHAELGRSGKVSDDVITKVVTEIKDRLQKARSVSFMPKLSYSVISFSRTDNAMVSPWGQAFSLLADVAAFPRKALTDSFFLRGLKVPEDDLIEAMNVADDALLRNLRVRGIKDRCKAELNLLTRIEKVPMKSRDRCELVWRILSDNSIETIDETLNEKEAISQKSTPHGNVECSKQKVEK
jgi:hypothetical protein